jgi:hypothetical protein
MIIRLLLTFCSYLKATWNFPAMLYVLRVRDAPWVKMGFTSGSIWRRIATGLWSNVHPDGCCGRLAWEDLELLALFGGTADDERMLQQELPPERGEFWPLEQLEALLVKMARLPTLPLPPRPEQPPNVDRKPEKLVCCGGEWHRCSSCDKKFTREQHLAKHQRSHMGVKVACGRCKTRVVKENLKRHRESKKCREHCV